MDRRRVEGGGLGDGGIGSCIHGREVLWEVIDSDAIELILFCKAIDDLGNDLSYGSPWKRQVVKPSSRWIVTSSSRQVVKPANHQCTSRFSCALR